MASSRYSASSVGLFLFLSILFGRIIYLVMFWDMDVSYVQSFSGAVESSAVESSAVVSSNRNPPPPRQEPKPIIKKMLKLLYNDLDPFSSASMFPGDHQYPYSHLNYEWARAIMESVQGPHDDFGYWVECGSYIGNSIITAQKAFQTPRSGTETKDFKDWSIVSIDPFTGSTNMWRRRFSPEGNDLNYNFLFVDDVAQIRIYETFLANIQDADITHQVIPIRATTIIGLKVVAMMYKKKLLPSLPKVIYVDSAHEEGESRLELIEAWKTLAPGGVLAGDDYQSGFGGLVRDINNFAESLGKPTPLGKDIMDRFIIGGKPPKQPINGLIINGKGWVLLKDLD